MDAAHQALGLTCARTKAIQQAIVDGGGVGAMFQSANDMQTRYETELQMFRDATDVGCQVLFSGGTGPQGDGGVERWNQFFEEQNEGGKRLASLCHTRPSGAFFGLAQLSPFTKSSSAWKDFNGAANHCRPCGGHAT